MQSKYFLKSLKALILSGVFLGGSLILTACDSGTHNTAQAQPTDAANSDTAPVSGDVMSAYIKVQTTLAADSTEGVAEQATKLDRAGVPGAREMADATDIAVIRKHFETVSNHLVEHIQQNGAADGTFRLAHCPMAFDDAGAFWLQTEEGPLANPYFGSMMLRCGSFKDTFAASGAASHSEHQH